MAVALAIGVLCRHCHLGGGAVVGPARRRRRQAICRGSGSTPTRHGMATHILLVQAMLVTVLSIMFVVLPSVQAAYQILSQLTVILYLVMYLLMFAAAIYLRYQPAEPSATLQDSRRRRRHVADRRPRLPRLAAGLHSVVHPAGPDLGRQPDLYVAILIGLTRLLRRHSLRHLCDPQAALARPGQRFRPVHLGGRRRPPRHPDDVGDGDRQPGSRRGPELLSVTALKRACEGVASALSRDA